MRVGRIGWDEGKGETSECGLGWGGGKGKSRVVTLS